MTNVMGLNMTFVTCAPMKVSIRMTSSTQTHAIEEHKDWADHHSGIKGSIAIVSMETLYVTRRKGWNVKPIIQEQASNS